jgi:hypothetical protein
MGYTHYFRFSKPKNITAAEVELKYQQAMRDCTKVVQYVYNKLGISLSGYSAHSSKYGGLMFNGARFNAHEDFICREHFSQNEHFNFCKTAYKPYDIAVVACLAILKYRLGDSVEISSDGNYKDFEKGTALAAKVLRRKIKNPMFGKYCEHLRNQTNNDNVKKFFNKYVR